MRTRDNRVGLQSSSLPSRSVRPEPAPRSWVPCATRTVILPKCLEAFSLLGTPEHANRDHGDPIQQSHRNLALVPRTPHYVLGLCDGCLMRLGRWAGVWVYPQVLVGVPGRRRAQLLETMGMGSCQATAGVKRQLGVHHLYSSAGYCGLNCMKVFKVTGLERVTACRACDGGRSSRLGTLLRGKVYIKRHMYQHVKHSTDSWFVVISVGSTMMVRTASVMRRLTRLV